MRFNFYKKGTQPKQLRKSSISQKSRKQVHKNLTHAHTLIKELFIKIPGDMSLSGWIRHFFPKWEKLKCYKSILNMVKGSELKFLSEPVKSKVPNGVFSGQVNCWWPWTWQEMRPGLFSAMVCWGVFNFQWVLYY